MIFNPFDPQAEARYDALTQDVKDFRGAVVYVLMVCAAVAFGVWLVG